VSQRLSYHSVDGFPGADNKAYYDREIAKLKLKAARDLSGEHRELFLKLNIED
jgi:hypothetical protein